jgi:hypothetical protein
VLEEARPAIYRVIEQCDQIDGGPIMGIVVRTAVEPASITSAVQQAVWSVDTNQPVARIQTMEEIVGRQLSTPSQSKALLGAFALLALLLAPLGRNLGCSLLCVTQRTNEIGVRMALVRCQVKRDHALLQRTRPSLYAYGPCHWPSSGSDRSPAR